MYKIKRKNFGMTPFISYGAKKKEVDVSSLPSGVEMENEVSSDIPEKNRPYKWKDVDYYKVIDDDTTRKFKEHLEFLRSKCSKSLLAKNLVKRINQYLKDLKGQNAKKIQYVSKDNPDTIGQDNTHMLQVLNTKDTLVYSKDANGEFKMVYEAERPHKENGKMVSNVTIDDVDDHMYKGKSYYGNSTSSYEGNAARFN